MGHCVCLRRVSVVLTVFLILSVLWPTASLGQGTDRTAEILASARERYESNMEGIRRRVEKRLDTLAALARRDKDPVAAAKTAKAMIDEFDQLGTLPNDVQHDLWEKQYALTAAEMEKAYGRAMAAYLVAEEEVLHNAVAAEADLFLSYQDLVPWGLDLLEAMPQEARVVSHAHDIVVDCQFVDSYRIELIAQRLGDSGDLRVEIPVASGERVPLSVLIDDDGSVRALLTIADGLVGADLGIARPAELERQEGDGVRVIASGGEFTIVSVRTKPVVQGEPPSTESFEPSSPDRPRTKTTAASLMPVGSVWRGTSDHNNKGTFSTRFEVKSVSSDTIVMQGSWLGSIRLELVYKYRGTTLALVGVRELSNTNGSRASVGGGGRVTTDGFTSSYNWRVSFGDTNNQVVKGTLWLTRE